MGNLNKIFLVSGDNEYTYEKLLKDVNNNHLISSLCKRETTYDVFLSIIISIINDVSIILLDADLSNTEMEALLDETSCCDFNSELEIDTLNDLIEQVKSSSSWNVTLFTSGTTGLPKKVSHNFKTLTRAVQHSDKHSNDVWGLAYNPTHIAGLQVFFQAFLNLNTIIDVFQKTTQSIFSYIENYNVTHISATPTFYRLLDSTKPIESVIRITTGGEKLDQNTEIKIKNVFPNAKLRNVYASTEAGTIFTSKGEYFEILPEMKDYAKIERNEILVHKSLVGISDIEDEWYRTGDIVDVVSSDPLRFKIVNRSNEMINVGGMKVNPNEVEDVIKSLDGVEDVLVYGGRNSLLGNILYADVVGNVTEKEIKIFLGSKLQAFKIPRIINFVNKLNLTRTGKKQR